MSDRPWMRSALALVVLALAIACLAACDDTIEAEDYDRACGADTDCVAVAVGDLCSCSCDVGAISLGGKVAYDEDRRGLECSNDCGPCPALPAAVCQAGTCGLR